MLLIAWLQEEWNKPSLTDHYLMKIISYLARLPGAGPLRQLNYFKIPWSWEAKKSAVKLSPEQLRAQQSHSMFSGIFGKKKHTERQRVSRGK